MMVLSFHIVCENIEVLFRWEYDVLSISKSDMIYEFEVKISRSDFKADAKKGKMQLYSSFGTHARNVPNYFSYVCPDGLIKEDEIPQFAGLYYAKDGELTCIKSPKRLHKTKHERERIINKIARVVSERLYLGACRLTYENKKSKERWEKHQAEQKANLERWDLEHTEQATEAKPLL